MSNNVLSKQRPTSIIIASPATSQAQHWQFCPILPTQRAVPRLGCTSSNSCFLTCKMCGQSYRRAVDRLSIHLLHPRHDCCTVDQNGCQRQLQPLHIWGNLHHAACLAMIQQLRLHRRLAVTPAQHVTVVSLTKTGFKHSYSLRSIEDHVILHF